MKRWLFLCIFVLMSGLAPSALAVLPGEVLSDPKLESRARVISQGLRCVVCQNQSIDDSDAPLAGDMRGVVRERLLAGDTDQQVKDYLVARYGNFVLMNPPLQQNTLALWLGPFVFLIMGGLGYAVLMRRNSAIDLANITALTEDERERLQSLARDTPS